MKVAHLFGGRKTSSRLLANLIQGEPRKWLICLEEGKTSSRLLASQIQGEYESGSFVWRKEDLEQITCQPDTRRTQKVAHLFGGRKDLEQITCQPDTRRI